MGKRLNISGLRIREERIKQNISAKALAESLQLGGLVINQNIIEQMENGSRKIYDFELVKIAEVLGLTISSLLQTPEGHNLR